jgi:hypothetical protein
LLEASFPKIGCNIARYEALGFSWSFSRPFLKEKKGEVLSHVGFLEYPIWVNGQRRKVGALHAICTRKDCRRQGLASQLIEEALQWAEDSYESVVLFSEIPSFYEKLSFRCLPEYRHHLTCSWPQGRQALVPLTSTKDDALVLRCFQQRAPLTSQVWVEDRGAIACFNALFATYPTYGTLYYSPSIDGLISYFLKDGALHLVDVVASKIPSLDQILSHLPSPIEEIYFYFCPDRLTREAIPEPYQWDNSYLMVHGNWPDAEPAMISPLSRC